MDLGSLLEYATDYRFYLELFLGHYIYDTNFVLFVDLLPEVAMPPSFPYRTYKSPPSYILTLL